MKCTENCTMNCHSNRDGERLMCILINLIKQVISCLKFLTFPDSSYDFYDIISYLKIHRNFIYKSSYSHYFIQRILNVAFLIWLHYKRNMKLIFISDTLSSCLMGILRQVYRGRNVSYFYISNAFSNLMSIIHIFTTWPRNISQPVKWNEANPALHWLYSNCC